MEHNDLRRKDGLSANLIRENILGLMGGVGDNPPCVVAVWGYSACRQVHPSRPSYSQHSLTRCSYFYVGHWRRQVAQRAFNPLVVGSNPT